MPICKNAGTTSATLHRILRAVSIALVASAGLEAQTGNQVPNPQFRGNQGAIAGDVTGDVPSGWRGFAVGDAAIDLSTIELPANALFPGSPPTRAVRLETLVFGAAGSDNGFDHNGSEFTLFGDREYAGAVYLRSANGDSSAQQVNAAMPIFDQTGAFTGDQPGSFSGSAGSGWTRFDGPAFTAPDGFSSNMAFRLVDDGGEDSVLIALPEVDGPVLANRLPNPDFEGTGGFIDGDVTGEVPDQWRAFAIDGASIEIETLPLAANAVFPGSPAGNAIEVAVDLGAGAAGFDHELARSPLAPAGYLFRPQIYIRSANNDGSDQSVAINTPVFDSAGFTGRAPGFFTATVDDQWRLYIGPTFSESPGTTTNLAVAVIDDGGEDTIQVAFPALLGPDVVFADGFEG